MYRNTRIAVKEIVGDGERKPTDAFSGLQSHYLFGRPSSDVGHAQKTPLKGQHFESLEKAQIYLGRGKSAGPTRVFTAPPSGQAAYYGAPPGWIGRRVQVQWNASHVRLIDPSPANCCASTSGNGTPGIGSIR
jgi:hypothetical protein